MSDAGFAGNAPRRVFAGGTRESAVTRPSPLSYSCYSDPQGQWRAKVTGALTTIRNEEGWEYAYRRGRIVSVRSPSGRELSFVASGKNLARVEWRDPASNISRVLVSLTRQPNGRVVAIDANGQRHSFAYESGRDGKLIGWMPTGRSRPDVFTYAKTGVLADIQPGTGAKMAFQTRFVPQYDKKGKDVRTPGDEKDTANYWLLEDDRFRYVYGRDRKAADRWLAGSITLEDKLNGAKQSLEYEDKRGVQTTISVTGEAVKTYFYRAPGKKHDGKLRRIERGGMIVLDNYYDRETGNLIESRDENRISTFYEYDPSAVKNPLRAGKPVAIHTGNRRKRELIAKLAYDTAGRVVERSDLLTGQGVKLTYDRRGQVATITDSSGRRSTFTYDPQGRVVSLDEGGQTQSAVYDEFGRVKSRKLPDGQTAELAYDALGRIAQVRQNGVAVETYRHDPEGRWMARTDGASRSTWFEYDARGNLLAEHQPNGFNTWYAYDPAGNRTEQIDGNGNKIVFAYDTARRLIKQTNPLGQTLTWEYNDMGRLKKRTNGVQTVTYNYDEKGRLALLDYGQTGEKLRYEYDVQSRPQKISTPTNTLTLFYDAAGRVLAKQFTRGDTSDRVLRYTYDTRGLKTSAVLSEKGSVRRGGPEPSSTSQYRLVQQTEYAYNPAGQLTELKSNGASICKYSYDAAGRLAGRIYGNGIQAKYAYDKFGRQTLMALTGGPLIEPLTLAYQWDAAGQLLSRTWNGEHQTYGYDLSGQLLTVRGISASPETPTSEIIPVSNAAGANPHLSTLNPQPSTLLESYRYDAAGNILEKFEHGLKTVMTYDAANQLVTSSSPINHQPSTINFQYDSAGRLLSQHSTLNPLGGRSEAETPQPSTLRQYGFLDKVLVLTKPDGTRIGFDYYPDGQLAAKGPLSASQPSTINPQPSERSGVQLLKQLVALKATDAELIPSAEQKAMGITEELVWDGLALLYRNGTTYTVEPHISGGVPISASPDPAAATKTYFINDILGTTLALITPERVEIVPLTAFGKPRATPAAVPTAAPAPPILSPEHGAPADISKPTTK